MKVLITRPRSQSDAFAAALEAAGFEPVFLPVIEIRPVENLRELEDAVREIDAYDWVVFSSANAVDVFCAHARGSAAMRRGGKPRIAAIGPKTAEALHKYGAEADFVPQEYVAEAIVPGLGNLEGKRFLLPRAEIGREVLPAAIRKGGGIAHEIIVYRTLPAEPDPAGLAALRSGVDFVTLTSPSTVENFVGLVRQQGLDPLSLPGEPRFVCIGPVTEGAAQEQGLRPLIVAGDHTAEGMIAALEKYVASLEVR